MRRLFLIRQVLRILRVLRETIHSKNILRET